MKTVTAAIIKKGDAVLLARRSNDEDLPGAWEFPGGKLNEGETPQQCLERELFEEFNVRSMAGEILTMSFYTYPHGSFNLLAIETTLIDQELILTVHDQYRWVSITDLLEFELAPADVPIAKFIQENQ